ncbi:sodium/hydrogen exchanger 3-like [Ipomoea triloba]|uniref:sodium/hydrogen exchanger 3-like n=1 Tax=Ipomoea triloba TaxID=35885 RepID=UPI00125E6A39|nr:sodium/hydrogen exchanger 3-like [Ipomoea triloba]
MGTNLVNNVVRLGFKLSEEDQGSINSITLFVSLLCACIVIGHLLEENRWINESITALVIGVCTGGVILLTSNGASSRILEFNEGLFFIYLLPPIIFNAGFQVKKKQFFRNFIIIMMFGAIGTLISFCIISFGAKELFEKIGIGYLDLRDYLAIGAIFSATDSVCTLQVLNQDETPLLYSLVFGEGVVNDATSVVLFNAIQKFDISNIDVQVTLKFAGNFLYLFSASTLLGVVVGLLSAYLIKKICFGRHSTDREIALMILLAYLSYMLAELFDLSGILTVFFCGIVMSHYTWHNVTASSQVTTRHAFATLSFIAEIFIFLYVGMDALDMEKWNFVKSNPGKYIGVSAVLLGLVLVGRACFVFLLSLLSNCTKRTMTDRINFKQQVIIWWAGLMRGSVSMALAYNQFTRFGHTQQPANAITITCTITVVLFSNVVFGLLTKPLVRWLLPQSQHLGGLLSPEQSALLPLLTSEQGLDVGEMGNVSLRRPSSLCMLLSQPTNTIHYYWRKFDDSWMRPVFGGGGGEGGGAPPGSPKGGGDILH